MAAENRGVAYIKPGTVEIQSIPFPKLVDPTNKKKAEHGVLLKIISTNICGSDQHMVRGRTTAPAGLILGHEITGEVIEAGRDVIFIKKGDIVSVPFNIACGRCRNCNEGKTGICLTVNPGAAGRGVRVRGHGRMGRRTGRVRHGPLRDFNLLKFPDKDEAMAKIKDLDACSATSSRPATTAR
jgi:glutathione-independent formaldehyde dehydrogenase